MMRRTLQILLMGCTLLAPAVLCSGQEMEQEPIVIKGEQGAPGTIYIAPWQKLGGALDSDPLEAEFELDAQPLDRDVFLRELKLQRRDGDGPATESGASPSAGQPPVESN